MPVDILITVIVTAAIQSIFGVGVLLFGTPVLLLLNYSFIDTLSVLLPISIAINLLQIIKHYTYLDVKFYQRVLIYTIPFVVIFLLLISTTAINIGFLVGGFLILVALKSFFPKLDQQLLKLLHYERTYLALMGLVHGLTNLGGSLLTAIVHGKNYSKHATRVTVASCYATFAFFQLLTLLWIGHQFAMSYADNVHFLQIGVIVFLLMEETVYNTINDKKYSQLFAVFLLISGMLLITK